MLNKLTINPNEVSEQSGDQNPLREIFEYLFHKVTDLQPFLNTIFIFKEQTCVIEGAGDDGLVWASAADR